MNRLHCGLHHLLTASVLSILYKSSIYNAQNFIQTNPDKIVRITGLNYKDVLLIKDSLFVQCGARVYDGLSYFTEVISMDAIICSGIKNLDILLDGGFATGNLYEICGISASGKTQICMTIAVNLSKKLKQPILYVDSKNDVYANRMVHISQNQEPATADIGHLMNNIKVCQVHNIYELSALLHDLDCTNQQSERKINYRFIIIDSLTSLLYQFLCDQQSEGLCLLNHLVNVMKYISVTHHAVILVTNLITKWTSDSETDNQGETEENNESVNTVQKPALGKYWARVPSTRITVQRLGASNECLITILKSISLPIGKSGKILITESGVQ